MLAPQSYYTSDRMITGEDYQVVPLTINQSIAKVRSVNRAISGTSRYYDLKDVYYCGAGSFPCGSVAGTAGYMCSKQLIRNDH